MFSWWLNLMSGVFPSTISCYSRGSFLRQVRCRSRLMCELGKLKGLFMATRPMGSETVRQSQAWPRLWRHCSVCGDERIGQPASHTCATEWSPFPTFLLGPLRKHFKADARHHIIKCTALCSGAHVSLRSKAGGWGVACRGNGGKTCFCQSWFDNWLIKFRWNNDWRGPTLG